MNPHVGYVGVGDVVVVVSVDAWKSGRCSYKIRQGDTADTSLLQEVYKSQPSSSLSKVQARQRGHGEQHNFLLLPTLRSAHAHKEGTSLIGVGDRDGAGASSNSNDPKLLEVCLVYNCGTSSWLAVVFVCDVVAHMLKYTKCTPSVSCREAKFSSNAPSVNPRLIQISSGGLAAVK